jgi:GNAT superfamily N-acetyltransferase
MIREFQERDYEDVVAVHNAVDPVHLDSVEDRRHYDLQRETRIDWERWVYEHEGRVVGYTSFNQMSWMFHPRKFYVVVLVHPEHQGRGIGSRLYEHLQERLARFEPLSCRTEINEAWAAGRRFAEKRGYKDGMRERESKLDLTRFDPGAFARDLERVSEQGIVIVDYDALAEDPERHRKIYEIDGAAGRDMPMPEPFTQPSYENFCKKLFEHPKFLPEGNMLALDEGAYVGISNLWRANKPEDVYTGFTGVLREYRGRGIATALKVRALTQAKAMGYRDLYTSNDSTNAGMLGINRRLGFEFLPAWIDYAKTFPVRADADAGVAAGAEEAREEG